MERFVFEPIGSNMPWALSPFLIPQKTALIPQTLQSAIESPLPQCPPRIISYRTGGVGISFFLGE
jgi:hypothetical protein